MQTQSHLSVSLRVVLDTSRVCLMMQAGQQGVLMFFFFTNFSFCALIASLVSKLVTGNIFCSPYTKLLNLNILHL